MPAEHNLRYVLSRSTRCLAQADLPYALVGAWALAVWGRVRATHDLDFLVMANEGDLDRLAIRMAQAGMEVDSSWLDANPWLQGDQIRLQCRDVAIDLMRPRDAQDLQALRRRRRKRLEGCYYWFVSAEDLILQKIKVGRPRDFDDALSIIERGQGTLNRIYLRRWAGKLGVSSELRYLFAR